MTHWPTTSSITIAGGSWTCTVCMYASAAQMPSTNSAAPAASTRTGPPSQTSSAAHGRAVSDAPAARCDRQEARAEPGGEQGRRVGRPRARPLLSQCRPPARRPAGARVATACAAIPSPRPVKPSCSVVVALTLTRSAGRPSSPATRATIAARCGPILGCSQIRVTSTCSMRPPAAATRSRACVRKIAESAPAQRASVGGKWLPMSPAPSVPSSASVSACSPTSASEWPSRRSGQATRTPSRTSAVAGRQPVHVEAEAGAAPPRRPRAAARRARDPRAR